MSRVPVSVSVHGTGPDKLMVGLVVIDSGRKTPCHGGNPIGSPSQNGGLIGNRRVFKSQVKKMSDHAARESRGAICKVGLPDRPRSGDRAERVYGGG